MQAGKQLLESETHGHSLFVRTHAILDDMEVAPDFYSYFASLCPLLDVDPSLWCISAWNDNGKRGFIDTQRNSET